MDDSFCLSIIMVLTLKDKLTAQKEEDVFYWDTLKNILIFFNI